MAQLSITSSDPSDGDTDVFVNNPLDVTFGNAVNLSSVTNTSVVLTDQSTDSIIDTTVELISTTVVRLTPIGSLAEDTVYRISFPGTDTALSASFVLEDAVDFEALATTLTVQFRTGSRSFIDDSAVDKDAGDLSLEGDLNLPTHVKALGEFVVKSMVPRNHSADVPVDLDGSNKITITFDNVLSSGDFSASWLDVDVFPMMDDTTWLGTTTGDSFGGSIPGFDIGVVGDALEVTFSGNVPKNVGIQIELDQFITDEDGNEYGPNEFQYSITTDRYPSIAGVHVIQREIKAAASELTDDYIAAVLLAKSVEFESRFAISNTISDFNWVVNSTIVEILDDVELERAIVQGTRRQLGDMNVAIDPVINKLSLKHARAQKKVELSARTLLKADLLAKHYHNEHIGDTQRTTRRWFGVSGRLVASRFITFQNSSPASNTALNRSAKIPPGQDWW